MSESNGFDDGVQYEMTGRRRVLRTVSGWCVYGWLALVLALAVFDLYLPIPKASDISSIALLLGVVVWLTDLVCTCVALAMNKWRLRNVARSRDDVQ